MDLKQMKEKQQELIKKELYNENLRKKVTTNTSCYNELCDKYCSRSTLRMNNIMKTDIHKFLEETGVKFKKDTVTNFFIEGIGLELIVNDGTLNVILKSKDIYKSYNLVINEIDGEIGHMHKSINVDGKWLFTDPESSFLDKLKSMDVIEVEKVNTALEEGINNAKNALGSPPGKSIGYHYSEYENEDNQYNSVSEIIERDF